MSDFADPYLSKEAWVQTVTPLARRNGLDKLPTRKAVTAKDKDIAKKQSIAVSKRSFGMPDGYDKIQWKRSTDE